MIDQQMGESVMLWSVRIAVLLYLLRVALVLRNRHRTRVPSSRECWLWTIGCFSYVIHVILAFHFVHNWSHDQAWQHTAIETDRMTGIGRGEGLWVNYLFTVVWLADVLRLWAAHLHAKDLNRTMSLLVHMFIGFIVFNATVVFGAAIYRYLAIPVAILLGWAWYQGRRSARQK